MMKQIFNLFVRDKNAEELEAYYKKKFAETSDRWELLFNLVNMWIIIICIGFTSYIIKHHRNW